MRVALFALNASYSHTNLAVRAIGACLKRSGTETELIEYCLGDRHDEVLAALYRAHADVYGFSVYIWNAEQMFRFAAELKVLLPDAFLVFGGPEVSFEDEQFFSRHPAVDSIIAGEGEDAFPALCGMLSRAERPSRILMAEPYRQFTDSGIWYDEIGAPPRGLVYYESVRGCPFSCAYCLSSVGDGIRAKSAEHTLADLLAFEKFDGIRTVKLVDRTFNFDRERAKIIWRALMGEPYTKEYHFEVSAALLDEESIALLARAPEGKFRLEIGVQSTNPETIRAVRRTLDTERTLSVLKALHAPGNLHLHADLIAGLPYEDYASFGRSFDAVYGLSDVLQLGFLKLLRGSGLRRDAEKYGIRYSPHPPYEVLSTDAMSFEEVMRLSDIEGMLERLSNSGKFSYTFPYLPMVFGSPFAFFEGLCTFARERFGTASIARIGQTEVFRLVMNFAEESARRGVPISAEEIRERLAIDYMLGETRRLPPFLMTHTVSEEEKTYILATVPAGMRSGCEVVRFPFLSPEPVIIDRVRKMIRRVEHHSS